MKLTEQNGHDLYNVSYKCMEMRNRGCNGNCVGCPLNVSLYMKDEKEALLMKTSAMLDHEKMLLRQQDENEWWWAKAVFVVLLIALFCFTFRGCLFGDKKPTSDDPAFDRWQAKVWPQLYENRMLREPPPVEGDQIRVTIIKVAQNIRDANQDGLIDCIDYGMVFHEYWPSSKIMWHSSDKMSHIFVQVYVGRDWIDVEPDSVLHGNYIRYDVKSNSREITVKEIMRNTQTGIWVW